MKKLIAMLLAVIMIVGMFAGCGKDEPSVYWLNFKPESDVALQEIAQMYKEKTGVEVKVVTAASGTYEETLTAEMDKGDKAPTMFVVGNAAAAKSWGDYCLDLTGTPIANELNTDSYNVYNDGGKLCSIGYCFECYGIIVNTALLEKAGYARDYITNFATLKEVAEDVHARAAELGFDAFAAADMDDSSSWRFTGHMINLEYYYESVDAPDAWKACPAELTSAYMDNFKNLYDLMINNSLTPATDLANGGHDPQGQFIAGQAMFLPQGNWTWADLSGAGMSAEDLTMIPYYCGVAGEENVGLNNGTENCWAINAKASEADQKATMDFMMWLVTDPEASAKAVATFGAMPYKSAVTSTNPFLAISNEYAAAGKANMWWATNYQPNVNDYRSAVVSALNDYNANPSAETWAKVETAFIDGWAVQYQAANG